MIIFDKKYPEFFNHDRNCGAGVPEGWEPFVDSMLSNISKYCNARNIEVPQIYQIKEKFASIRIYHSLSNIEDEKDKQFINRLISECILDCDFSCMFTGERGVKYYSAGGYYVSCTPAFAEEYGFDTDPPDMEKYLKFREKYCSW